MSEALIVNVTYDPEAKIWYTQPNDDLFGVIAYAPSIEELKQVLPNVILDMIEENRPEWIGHNIAVQIVAVGIERINIAA
jgi:hypothetical protein